MSVRSQAPIAWARCGYQRAWRIWLEALPPFAKQGGTTEQFRPFGWNCFLRIQSDFDCEVIRLSYIEKVLSRLNIPGLILLIAGSVAVVSSEKIADKIGSQKMNLIIKAAGGAAALIGALILLDFIG